MFLYSLITEKQNYYINLCERVYWFLDTDLEVVTENFAIEKSAVGAGVQSWQKPE